QPLALAAVEVLLTGQQRDAQPVGGAMLQPGFVAQIAAGADRHDSAEILRECKGDGAGDAPAAGEAGQVGAVGVEMKVAAHVIQHIQDDAHALPGWDAVAGVARRDEDDAAILAQFLERFPAGRLVAGGDKDDGRQRPLGLLGHVQFVTLRRRVVPFRQPVGGGGVKAAVGEDEGPIQARRLRHGALGVIARLGRGATGGGAEQEGEEGGAGCHGESPAARRSQTRVLWKVLCPAKSARASEVKLLTRVPPLWLAQRPLGATTTPRRTASVTTARNLQTPRPLTSSTASPGWIRRTAASSGWISTEGGPALSSSPCWLAKELETKWCDAPLIRVSA